MSAMTEWNYRRTQPVHNQNVIAQFVNQSECTYEIFRSVPQSYRPVMDQSQHSYHLCHKISCSVQLWLCGWDCLADLLTWIMLFKAQSGKFKANKILDVSMISKKNKAKAFHSALNIEMRGFWKRIHPTLGINWQENVTLFGNLLKKLLYLTLFWWNSCL